MKEYLVTYKLTAWVEAENADEAYDIAVELDGSECDWELMSVKEC